MRKIHELSQCELQQVSGGYDSFDRWTSGVACFGSALWAIGSSPSVLGMYGGALATASTCTYWGRTMGWW